MALGERTWLWVEEIVALITAISCCLVFHWCNGTYEWVGSSPRTDMLMLKALMDPFSLSARPLSFWSHSFCSSELERGSERRQTGRERERERGRADCPLEKTAHTDNHLKDVNKGFSLSVYLNGEDNVDSLAENAGKHKWCLSSTKRCFCLSKWETKHSLDVLPTYWGPFCNADGILWKTGAFL